MVEDRFCYFAKIKIRMNEKKLSVSTIKKRLKPLFKKINVNRAILFGSFARRTETRTSDLDIIIVQRTNKRYLDRYNDFSEIYNIIKGFAIDLLIYTPEELESISDRKFISGALKDGVLLYGN